MAGAPSSLLPPPSPAPYDPDLAAAEEARVELGATEVGRRSAVVALVLFLLVLVPVPIVRAVREGAGPFAPALTPLTGAGSWAITWELERRIDGLEGALEDGSPWRAVALPWVQAALVAAGGVGNETAIVGRGGWLHLRTGLDALLGKPFLDPGVLERRRDASPAWEELRAPDPRPAVLALRDGLARRGITLVFLPVPPKAAVHPEGLTASRVDPAGLHNRSLPAFLAELAAAGVLVVDPAPALRALAAEGRPAYLKTDSHWSPEGVDRVAALVAERLRAAGLAPVGEPGRYRSDPVVVTGRGDLLAALGLTDGVQARLFPPETATLDRVLTADGAFARPDRGAEVLLLGDSFSNVFSRPELGWGAGGGLAERLAFHLGAPVDRLARDAGGPALRRELADETAMGRLDGKRVVVWEIALRELTSGDWPVVSLPDPAREPGG